MFLRATTRKKDGKTHRYWSVVENRRVADGRVLQRHVLYLGEINDSQARAWRRSIEVLDEREDAPRTVALFPEDRIDECAQDPSVVRLRVSQLRLCQPRVWGSCWLALKMWERLELDRFWSRRLARSRKGTRWEQVLFVLVAYRLLSPGSEWRLHRQWFERSALKDLLGADERLGDIHKLYECHDRILEHKTAVFDHLVGRWKDLFNVEFDVLLYDLTSTYFEANPPFEEGDKRRFGHSRDKRSDCVQVVIALVVTPQGLPLAYEVLPGNTADNTTLRDFLRRIESQYGKTRRVWVMDRGIPTEAVLAEMRRSDPPVYYLVGTPKGRLSRLEKELLLKPWHEARPGVQVKLLAQDEEMYVFAQSRERIAKERAMRKRRLKGLWARLAKLSSMKLSREALLMKLGAAQNQSPSAWRLVEVKVDDRAGAFTYGLRRNKLREVRRREGRYLLRTNLTSTDPAELWRYYIQLVQVEQAFKDLKGDLAVRPIHHQLEHRVEAHIFIAFLAYCLHVTLAQQLRPHAGGLTSRSVLDKFAAVQMLDVHIPTTDGRELVLSRYTEPEREIKLLLERLDLELPGQPPPRITTAQAAPDTCM
ncbi:MAG: IS1634 family transposase [Phycisphaerae bacterium]